ncbi:MAG: hypothetical protein RR444_04820 [Oscillospiraceae bacterium]
MIDLAEYIGIDDSNFAIKLGCVNELTCDELSVDGALVGLGCFKVTLEEREKNRVGVLNLAGHIKAALEFDTNKI